MNRAMTVITVAIMFLLMGIVWALMAALPVWLLWNWLMPELFGIKEVTLVQALGVCLLSAIMFKTSVTSRKD